jgi:hypothetical protein
MSNDWLSRSEANYKWITPKSNSKPIYPDATQAIAVNEVLQSQSEMGVGVRRYRDPQFATSCL